MDSPVLAAAAVARFCFLVRILSTTRTSTAADSSSTACSTAAHAADDDDAACPPPSPSAPSYPVRQHAQHPGDHFA